MYAAHSSALFLKPKPPALHFLVSFPAGAAELSALSPLPSLLIAIVTAAALGAPKGGPRQRAKGRGRWEATRLHERPARARATSKQQPELGHQRVTAGSGSGPRNWEGAVSHGAK